MAVLTVAVASEDLAELDALLARLRSEDQTYTYTALRLTNVLTTELGYTASDASMIVDALEDRYTQKILDLRYNLPDLLDGKPPLQWPSRITLEIY